MQPQSTDLTVFTRSIFTLIQSLKYEKDVARSHSLFYPSKRVKLDSRIKQNGEQIAEALLCVTKERG